MIVTSHTLLHALQQNPHKKIQPYMQDTPGNLRVEKAFPEVQNVLEILLFHLALMHSALSIA